MTTAGTANADLFDLTSKVAVVTGGSRGLGREMVLAFARRGADVVIASRKPDACEALAREVTNETGRTALGVPFHAGRWEDNDRLAEAAYQRFGKVDVLVNNAGMSPLYSSLPEVTEELYDKVLAVNLKGPFRLSSLVGSRMAQMDGGSIINVSSVAAVQPTPGEVPYGVAKAGLNNLTLALARAFAPRVRVNCIMPGPFLTDISKAWDMEAFEQGARRGIPLQRGGRPDEIVGAALYLASDASSYTTGAVIKVDGGAVYPPA
jgi:NAD(P)-dependent dehydrogenase (short-subunit alcohol dehydrogenase family)